MHSLIFGKEGPPPSSSVRVLMRFTAPAKNPLRARRRVGGQMPPPSRTRSKWFPLSLSHTLCEKNETLHSVARPRSDPTLNRRLKVSSASSSSFSRNGGRNLNCDRTAFTDLNTRKALLALAGFRSVEKKEKTKKKVRGKVYPKRWINFRFNSNLHLLSNRFCRSDYISTIETRNAHFLDRRANPAARRIRLAATVIGLSSMVSPALFVLANIPQKVASCVSGCAARTHASTAAGNDRGHRRSNSARRASHLRIVSVAAEQRQFK